MKRLSDLSEKENELHIDLHMHSKNSDGMETTEELLQKFKNYDIISFTDHDSVRCYYDLKTLRDNAKNLLIIPGVELSFSYHKELRDMLGYGIDVDMINDYLVKRYPQSQKLKNQQICLERTKEVFKKKGLKFDDDLKVVYGNKSEAYVVMYHSLMKYPENIEKYDFIADNGYFYRHYYSNRETDFFVDETFDLPSMDEVVSLIHEAGGLAFLAHPCAYSAAKAEWEAYVDSAVQSRIDGLEVYHYSANEPASAYLYQTAKEKGLFISGGSDFHEVSRASGFGTIKVPFSETKSWMNRVAVFEG
jgi:predicted metal-dependent phosphoesterase TrpH